MPVAISPAGTLCVLPGLMCLLLFVPGVGGDARAGSITGVDFLGTARLPENTGLISGIGGLSDLAYDPVADHWVLLSDEARAFSMSVDLADGVLDPGDAVVTAELPLALSGSADDPEGIDIAADGSWWVSTEGNANANDANGGGFEPVVARIDPATGNAVEELPLPAPFDPIAPNGIRHNRGFEAVALTPDGSGLFTGAEAGLSQDELSNGSSALTRLVEYDLISGAEVAQYPYLLDAVGFQNGLVSMLATGPDTLLALERTPTFFRRFVPGFRLRLFEVDLSGASNVMGADSIAADFENGLLTTAAKTLLLDFATRRLIFDNIEGFGLGPWDGLTRPLLMIADDGDPLSDNELLAFNLTFDEVFPAAAPGPLRPFNPTPTPATLPLLLFGLLLCARRWRSLTSDRRP